MTCPRRYNLESIPDACAIHCPIRRGIYIPHKWYTVNETTAYRSPAHNRIDPNRLRASVSQGKIARRVTEYRRNAKVIPECGLVAFLIQEDADQVRKQARQVGRVKRYGIWQRGARRLGVIWQLEHRELQRKAIVQGHDQGLGQGAARILSDSEIADLEGVSRQAVGQHKKRLGYT